MPDKPVKFSNIVADLVKARETFQKRVSRIYLKKITYLNAIVLNG
jgi:hypothetical protein